MTVTKDDFNKIWASTSSVPTYTFSDTDYQNGWEFVGNLPPTRAMWDELQRRNDEKMQLLYTGASFWVDSVADLRDADAEVGNVYATKGYYAPNDGGNGFYIIRADNSDTDDGGSIIILDNGNVAELITDGTVTPEQFGAFGDGTHDDSDAIQAAVNFASFITFPKNYLFHDITIQTEKHLVFKGIAKPLYYGDDNSIFRRFISVENADCTIIGFHVEGDNYDSTVTAVSRLVEGCLYFENCENVTIKDSIFHNLDCNNKLGTPGTLTDRRAVAITAIEVDNLIVDGCVFDTLNKEEVIWNVPASFSSVKNNTYLNNCVWRNLMQGYSCVSTAGKSIKITNCVIDGYLYWGNCFNLICLYVNVTNNFFKNVQTETLIRTTNANESYNQQVVFENNIINETCRLNVVLTVLGNDINVNNNIVENTVQLVGIAVYNNSYNQIKPSTINATNLICNGNTLRRRASDEHDFSAMGQAWLSVRNAEKVILMNNRIIAMDSSTLRSATLQNTINAVIANNYLPVEQITTSSYLKAALLFSDGTTADRVRAYSITDNVVYVPSGLTSSLTGFIGTTTNVSADHPNYINISNNVLSDFWKTVSLTNNDITDQYIDTEISDNVGFT